MRARTGILGATAALLLTLTAVPAGAASVADPNDVPGRLDLKRVVGRKASPNAPMIIKIATWGNWPKRLLDDAGKNRIFVLFNVDADPGPEYVGEISSTDGTLHMDITGNGSAFEPLPVTRPNRHSIRTVVPGGSPPNPPGPVKIAAKSKFVAGSGACTTPCRDRAPDRGWLRVIPA